MTRTLALTFALGACSGELDTPPAVDAGHEASALDATTADTSVAPDAADTSAPDASPTPKSLPSLALWLDASQGVHKTAAGGVDRWADQSGQGNDALQPTAKYMPQARPTGLLGKPSVHVEAGTHLAVSDSPSLQVGVGDFYVGVVFSYVGVGPIGYGLVFSKQDPTVPFAGPGIFADFVLPDPSTAIGGQVDYAVAHTVRTTSTGLDDGKARLFAFTRSQGAIGARLNGKEQATAMTINVNGDALGRPIFLGAQLQQQGVIQELTGDLAEVVMLVGPTPQDVGVAEAYLLGKYGL